MREIEPKSVGRYQRPGLLDVRSEDFAQRCVKEMSCSVIRHRASTLLSIDMRFDGLIHTKRA